MHGPAAPATATSAALATPATPADIAPPEAARFLQRVAQALAEGSLQRLQLARPQGQERTLQKLLLRPVQLRGQPQLACVWRHTTRDVTRNLALPEAQTLLAGLVGRGFLHAHLQTRSHDVQLLQDRKGRWALRVGRLPQAVAAAEAESTTAADAASRAAAIPAAAGQAGGAAEPGDDDGRYLAHDRQRRHPLALDLPWLQALGITDAQQRLVPAMARKWRQINKFSELLGHALASSPLAGRDAATPLRVLDFGAGKGYLSFAVHQMLRQARRVPDVLGVELRPDLCAQANAVVAQLRLQGLRFAAGDVRSHAAEPADIMIALHACDTATDVALHRGVQAGAAIIVCAPCCHQQLRPQLRWPAVLQPLLRHGIHQAAQAEMLTDALRALLLELQGYESRVFEFISPEATSKNRMVLAVRRAQRLPAARVAALQAELDALKAFWGVREQALETLLAGGSVGLAASAAPHAAALG